MSDQQVVRQAKLSVAIDRWMAENGCAACLSMSLMGEDGAPSACEVDVVGAVSMLVLRLASGNAPAFLDGNNKYSRDRSKYVATHCSSVPGSLVGREVEISELDVLGASLGRENCFSAVKGRQGERPAHDPFGSCRLPPIRGGTRVSADRSAKSSTCR